MRVEIKSASVDQWLQGQFLHLCYGVGSMWIFFIPIVVILMGNAVKPILKLNIRAYIFKMNGMTFVGFFEFVLELNFSLDAIVAFTTTTFNLVVQDILHANPKIQKTINSDRSPAYIYN